MNLLATDDGYLPRFLVERGLGAIYLIAFVVAARQFPALCGERGLEPATELLRFVRFRDAPSLFHWRYSDRFLVLVAGLGIVLSASVVVGLASAAPLPVTMAVWLVLWALYLSIVNVGISAAKLATSGMVSTSRSAISSATGVP